MDINEAMGLICTNLNGDYVDQNQLAIAREVADEWDRSNQIRRKQEKVARENKMKNVKVKIQVRYHYSWNCTCEYGDDCPIEDEVFEYSSVRIDADGVHFPDGSMIEMENIVSIEII